jgi:hypothetical protein
MGFFEKISRSPSEKKLAAHIKEQDRRVKAELGPNQAVLPDVKSMTLELFQMSMETNSNWRETVSAISKLKDVARKANSVEDLKLAASLHTVAYMKEILSLNPEHPRLSTFQNLKFHWYQIYEDLVDMYLVGKYINLEPSDTGDILEFLGFLDKRIVSEFQGTSELAQWIETRRYQRKEYPALLNLENL